MVSYEHTQLAKLIREIDAKPSDPEGHSSWAKADKHLQLLRRNAGNDEVILYAISRPSFIFTVFTPGSDIFPPDCDDLVQWSSTPYTGRASYSWSEGASDLRAVSWHNPPGNKTLRRSQNLVLVRQMQDTNYPASYELLQEFVHATEIYWLAEQLAYCDINENGDIQPVVSITAEGEEKERLVLITCRRKHLEQYMAATGNIIVRFFDFMMIGDGFSRWGNAPRERKAEANFLFYDQCLHPDGHGYTHGTQLLPVTMTRDDLFRDLVEPGSMRADREHASFIIQDFRNDNKVVEVSAAPGHTVNYFNMQGTSLPHELSPAFFRPEVLSRYKADREKYTIDEVHRFISCRGVWDLRSYDINDAGQVHAYLCDLRNLPDGEQMHWKIHNEKPKGTISKRAYENDFQGEWASYETPLDRVMYTVRGWDRRKPDWWKINDEDDLRRVNTPVSNSKDEWGSAFVELSKAVIEGFQVSQIRSLLQNKQINFESQEQSLSLLRKLLSDQTGQAEERLRLEGLRHVQRIRSKVQSHRSGSEADEMAKSALAQHGTYRCHFEHVCNQVAEELELIEQVLGSAHRTC